MSVGGGLSFFAVDRIDGILSAISGASHFGTAVTANNPTIQRSVTIVSIRTASDVPVIVFAFHASIIAITTIVVNSS